MTRQRVSYALFAVALVVGGSALYVITALGWVLWLVLAVSVVALAGTVTRVVLDRRLGTVVPPAPPTAEVAAHRCRYCSRSAVGVLLVVADRPSSWVYHCERHLGFAIEVLRLRRRRRGGL